MTFVAVGIVEVIDMGYPQYASSEVAARGEAMYARLSTAVEAGNAGKFLVMDIRTGDYEVDADDLAATKRLIVKRPNGFIKA